ncbi:phosphonate metabolism transcriptional regulator PhnF [Aquibium carbonis]|uniref:Phosphonate metabolism transcriptional regulator PhnF n=1 Tax=Aquibium carbonis TaxID=2495581 RepID=A0A3S0ATV8_9HYPH|nr:phosphonate metabolism transcriptional regulator PhnF [Aquibium carbonis]RST86984.1 phosphonate metabolism transcriptional regulator PhnF [Aquibium carbonis]
MKSQWAALYENLKSDIEDGRLAAGERLPPEQELSARHGVSRNTVRRAYLALSQDGSIRSINGRGSFVMRTNVTYEIDAVSRFRDVLEKQGVASSSQLVDSAVTTADAELAARLETTEGSAVLSQTTIILGDGVPFILTTRYFPADLIEDFEQRLLRVGSFTSLLKEAKLGDLHRKSTTVGARLPDERESSLLKCPRNAPLLDVVATGMLADGRIVEWQHAVMNSRLIKLSFVNA